MKMFDILINLLLAYIAITILGFVILALTGQPIEAPY
jgi:hypothetical protein